MKKGICFIMTAVLGAMLLTACGDSGQSGNTNDRDRSESSTVQSSAPEAENQDGTAEADALDL